MQTHRNIITFVISLSFFMEALDSTVINTAIPAMSKSLSVHPIDLKIALISYLLSLAIFIPISGWIADKFGTKKTYLTSVAIFTISSVCCGFVQNIDQLIIARLFQGLGGALTLPIGRLIILRTFNREQFITVMNQIVTIGGLGIMLGPVIGGLLTYYFSWQWIFWINIPIGLGTIILTYRFFKNTPPLNPPPLDLFGFLYFGLGLSGFTFGLSVLSQTMVDDYLGFIIIAIALLFLTGYWYHSKTQAHPIVNTELLIHRTFRTSVLGNLITRLGFGGIPFILPLLFQTSFGYSPQLSGLLIAPMAIGILISKQVTLPLLRLIQYRNLLIINTCLTALVIALFGFIGQDTPLLIITAVTTVYGFLIALQYGAMNSLAYADISHEKLSSATSIVSTIQQIAQSFGVAISAIALHFLSSLFTKNASLTLTVFHGTFYILSILTLLSVIVFKQLKPQDGYQMLAIHNP